MREFMKILESEIVTQTFETQEAAHPNHRFWFKVHYSAGEIVGVEEHNSYAGGDINQFPGKTWAETFLARVAKINPEAIDDAREFLGDDPRNDPGFYADA